MKLEPVITEKTTSESKEGIYTFYVDPSLTKADIKNLVNNTFDVHVVKVRTINKPKLVKKNYMGRKVTIKAKKKAIVILKDKEKIDIFEAKKSKK
jgi:large subunit ribosomal protein L23